jgi:hypothetical protein
LTRLTHLAKAAVRRNKAYRKAKTMSINTIIVGDEKPVIFMSASPRGEFEGEFDSYEEDEEEEEYEDEELTGDLDFDSFGGEDDEAESENSDDDDLNTVDGLDDSDDSNDFDDDDDDLF